MRLHPRHRIDIGVDDLAYGISCAATAEDPLHAAARVEARCGPAEDAALATLSARSAFDLLLDALALPADSELVMSAVTIPDMGHIAHAHGLRLVPVEVEPTTLSPTAEAWAAAIGPRTSAILAAHLYGGKMDLRAVAELARRRGVPLIEDCAQAWSGPGDTGDARALASLFSFGPIKTATALGGGLLVVRDAALLRRLRQAHLRWPVQPRAVWLTRALRFLALAPMRHPHAYGGLNLACAAAGVELQALLQGAVKGFPGGPAALLQKIRQRPGAPLLQLMERRIAHFDRARFNRRIRLGERLRHALGGTAAMPGEAQPQRTHWLVPFRTDDPSRAIRLLRGAGFDAAQGTTSLVDLASRGWLREVIYLPVYPEVPDAEVERLIATLRRLPLRPAPARAA